VIATLYEANGFHDGPAYGVSAITGKPSPPMPNRVSAWAIYDRFNTKDGEMVFVG